jgi:hypothetical protein
VGADRVEFIVANDAGRSAVAKVLASQVTPRQLRVFLVVLDQTAHWSKLSDRITLAQLAEKAGIAGKNQRDTEKRVADDLRRLDQLGVLHYIPGGRARGVASVVSIPPVRGVEIDPGMQAFRGVETDLLPGSKPTPKHAFRGVGTDPPPKERLPSKSTKGRRLRRTPGFGDGSAWADHPGGAVEL